MSTPTPDLKPHVAALPAGSECCGCCNGVAVETPREVRNRPALSAIAYRIGDYSTFRASLHALLSLSGSPPRPLADLHTRDDDDFTIALIDAFACAADVLTFYQERIANESYLRTAVERVSLQEMGKLIGYRLRPGVAAETWIAIALETPPAPPANLTRDPGSFVTGVPQSRTIDAGLKIQSVPGPNEKPQTFETLELLQEARPEWNAMQPWMSESKNPVNGDTFTYLDGTRTNLKSGDAIVLLGDEYINNKNTNNWDFRVVDSVVPQADFDRTLVSWKRGLGSITPFSIPTTEHPQVHVFRKRAAVFGHNAPLWKSMPDSFKTSYTGSTDTPPAEWPDYTLSPLGATANGGHVDLDAVYADVHNDSFVVLAKGGFNYGSEPAPSGTYVELYTVDNVAEASRAQFALSGKVTRLELVGQNYAVFQPSGGTEVRNTSVFAASEQLSFAEYAVDTAVGVDRIPVHISGDGLVKGRRLIVIGKSTTDGATITVRATLEAVHAIDATRCELEISPPLSSTLVRESVIVHGNVIPASHGESVSQILGAGDASIAFQRFELKQQPVTYRAAANELGAAAELTIRVGDVAWKERSTMFGAEPNDHAYALSTDEQGRVFAVFGDGVRGARLPSGVNNVRAKYRKGLGVDGNVRAGALTQVLSPPLGVKSATNPQAAQGGDDPEPADDARDSMPLTTRTLGRAVSVLDYEDFARAYSGIAKAQARVLNLGIGSAVVITIAGPAGALLTSDSPTWIALLGALRSSGDPHVPVVLLSYQASTFRLGLTIKRDPDYESGAVLANIEQTLRDRYSFVRRALAAPVQQSEVIAVVQSVPGVVAVDITRMYGGTRPAAQTVAGSVNSRLLASQMRVENGSAQPAELLTLDPSPLDELDEMP